jgi:glyoxylase-like metal-dependent hydrolase (beta-lactamase superfamily II)
MIEVSPGIYQLILPNPAYAALRYVNTYLVRGDSGYLLIDTGWDDEALASLKEQLTKIGVDFKDITQIIVTHAHPDHYGLAKQLKQLSGAKLALHYLEIDAIKYRYMNESDFLSRLDQWWRVNGVPTAGLAKFAEDFHKITRGFISPVLPDVTLHGGETIPTGVFNLQVLRTPGHSAGHISLYELKQKILFTGDHILPNINTNTGISLLFSPSTTNPLGDYLDSLEQVKQLEVNLVLPGHENRFTGLRKRAERLIRHNKQRTAEVARAIKTEPKTAYQISTELTWLTDIKGVSWQDLDLWNQRLAIAETVAHLESMRFAGRADKFFSDSVAYYRLLDEVK